jgi:uncharacterized cupredoxin-like copper-binding protein
MRASTIIATAVLAILLADAESVRASGAHGGHGQSANTGIGQPGTVSEVTRTVKVVMRENAYTPSLITVKKGETVRFTVRNAGKLVHEFSIGTHAMHRQHEKEMREMMQSGALGADRINHDKMTMGPDGKHGMAHDDPNSLLLEPGKSGTVIWKFSEDADLEFACNVPGHRESGMVGKIKIER